MSERSLKRLRALTAPWGGDIQVVTQDGFTALLKRADFSVAPFSKGIGILLRARTVAYVGPVERVRVSEVIHELGHIFGTKDTPIRSLEWDFLGWEIATAKAIKLPWKAWQIGTSDYMLADEGWNGEDIGSLSPKRLRRLVRTRLAAAREAKIVDQDDRPLCVR